MADFLFELGLEEIPARMIAAGAKDLCERIDNLLISNALKESGATSPSKSFSTPRRLTVLASNVKLEQSDLSDEVLGPAAKFAYRNGILVEAGLAFAKKVGVSTESLYIKSTSKGDYLATNILRKGKPSAEVIARALPTELASMYWPKSMYWRPGKPERFVRPVQWILALLDGEVVPAEWGGRTAGNVTYGHRVLHGKAQITVDKPSGYLPLLEQAKVMADVEVRREKIRKALDHVTRSVPDARWREDHPLVDKVTHMTELPSVILGNFEPEYLQLPEEVLVTVMRDHQNYFAVQGSDDKLLPHFLAVLNTEADERATGIIRHGNERVLRARFNDARFFYEFDQRTSLEARTSLLEKVTFQKDLGSYAAKTERVRAIAAQLGAAVQQAGKSVDLSALDEAVRLAKTDLTSELVKEFTELQGIVGGLYAAAQGKSETVAKAIYDQYLPASMEDAVPATTEGLLLSIADKVDTISGMFGLGLQPTGSKDPFALRRAANGIVKMLAEATLPLTLEIVANAPQNSADAVGSFLTERLEWYLREVRGGTYDVVKAVMATKPQDVRDAMSRVDAVTTARGSEDFAAISAAFKRMRNLVEQAKSKGEVFSSESSTHLREEAEVRLADEADRVAQQVEHLRTEGNYDAALLAIAELRPAVDRFFEKVMVMAPEPELRSARLGLLQSILNDFSQIADFSEIVVAG